MARKSPPSRANAAGSPRPWYVGLIFAIAGALVGGLFTLAAKESAPSIYTKNACQLLPTNLSDGVCVGCLNAEFKYGKCVVTNQDSTHRANQVDWPFAIRESGYYRILVTYAADAEPVPRSVKLFANGDLINEHALDRHTTG